MSVRGGKGQRGCIVEGVSSPRSSQGAGGLHWGGEGRVGEWYWVESGPP